MVLAITGASGVRLGLLLLELLLSESDAVVDLIVSEYGEQVLSFEQPGYTFPSSPRVIRWAADDMTAGPASGSYPTLGMLIAPCTMSTAARVATGVGGNLICRAADVTIKEKRNLIVAPRESPLSAIHLENLLILAQLGAVVMPPLLTEYAGAEDVEQMLQQHALHMLEFMGLAGRQLRWREEDA